MNCEKYLNLINDLVEGELDEQACDKVNLHIFSCRNCEAEFEILSREKEMYSHFLFDIEPSKDLSARFQAKLEGFNEEKIVLAANQNWFASVFNSLSFKPLFAGAIVLLTFGFGYFWFNDATNKPGNKVVSQSPVSNALSAVNIENNELEAKNTDIDLPKTVKEESISTKKVEKNLAVRIRAVEVKPKAIAAESKPFVVKKKQLKFENIPQLSNEELAQIKELQTFQFETANQMERVEMLLRAFRNVRFEEGFNEYDVSYEKQQARKLLSKNIELRQQSENYGSMLTSELLSRVEPHLLDISNLENNPSEEDVLEIKQRVKNQNIIVSLQSY
jgi:hypothetical protein